MTKERRQQTVSVLQLYFRTMRQIIGLTRSCVSVPGKKEDLDAMVRGAKAATVSSDVEARSNVRHDRARINASFLAFCGPAFLLFLALVIVILEPTKLCLPPESEQWPTQRLCDWILDPIHN
jgi:hypothetical protein